MRGPCLSTLVVSLASTNVMADAACRTPSSTTAIEALCSAALRDGDISRGGHVLVYRQTRPVYELLALQILTLGESSVNGKAIQDAQRTEDALRSAFRPTEVTLPENPIECAITPLNNRDAEKAPDDLIVEMSPPIANPYASPGQSDKGCFARISFGGRAGASWYWITRDSAANTGFVAKKLNVNDN